MEKRVSAVRFCKFCYLCRFLMLIVVIFPLVNTAFGQSSGSITGTVKDGSGATIVDATVTITNPAKSITQTATTNSDGVFVSPSLPPGAYSITVEKQGFKQLEKTNVILSTGDKINAGEFVLEVGGVAETVQVTVDAGQLQIKTESGERSDLISGQQLRNIGLNGRNVTDMAKFVPGVISGGASSGSGASTVTNIAGSFTINGTRNTQHEYTVDGVTNYNLGNNTGALVSVNPDALEEVKILTPNANEPNLIPSLIFGGIASVSNPVNTSVFGTFDQRFVINNFIDNLTKVTGKHTLKFGVYYQRASNASNSQNRVQSDIDFTNNATNPLNTNYPFANALLGVYNSYTQASTKVKQSYFYQDISWYVQDTWKITPRLTLDLGMRFSYYEPYHNIVGPESFFNPSLFDPSKAMRLYRPVCVGALTCTSGQATYRAIDPAVTGAPTLGNTQLGYLVGKLVPNSGDFTNGLGLTTNGYPPGGLDKHAILPQPRLGFAWNVTGSGKTVVRGGFGASYDRYRSDVTGNAAANPPYVLNPTLNFGYLQEIQPGGSGALSPSAITGTDRVGDFPVVYSYSIGVQRELLKDTVIDVSYVGSQSRHNPRRSNLNAIPYGMTFKASAQDPTRFAGGVVPATEPGLPLAHQAAGLSFSGATALSADFLRPYQGYADITYNSFDGNSTYNSLQVSLQRRFASNFTFGIAYTLSKVETTVSDEGTMTHISDPRGYDYALANFDRTHYFVANYVWNLPRGSRLIGNNWLTRAVLDNWTISGISSIASGNPAELGLSITGQDAGNRLFGSYTNGNLSGQQPRFYVSGNPQSAPNQIDTTAFTVPGINDRGPYPRMYLRNPGFNTHDLSILKNIPFDGEGKRYLQLRVEMFNFLNHTQFSGVNRTTNITNAAGQTGAAIFGNYTGLAVTNNVRPSSSTAVLGTFFGEYNGARDPRIIQLAAKFYF